MVDQIIRPAALPDRPNPVSSEKVPVDNGVTVGGATIEALVNAGRPLASQAEAEAGINSTKGMSPLATKQAIDSQVPGKITSAISALNLGTAAQADVNDFATFAQGAKADTAVQSVNAGSNVTVDVTDPQNPIISATGGVTDGNKGDVTVSGGGSTWQINNNAITDIKVDSLAAIKSSKLAFSQNEADTATFPLRSVYNRLRESISVLDTGAKGDGTTDDTVAFQEAIDYAQTRSLKTVYVPAHNESAYYRITSPLIITKSINIVGEHPRVTIGGFGLTAAQYLFYFDGTVSPNLEQVGLISLTVRPNISGSLGRGVDFNRVANILMRDVIIYGGVIGIEMRGDRSYNNNFENVIVYGPTLYGLRFSSFTGGGQHNFRGCAFSAATGVSIDSGCEMSNLNFFGCGWETCTTQAFEASGTVRGLGFYNAYFEKNNSTSAAIRITPASGKTIRGVVAHGGFYETDAEPYTFLIGGVGVVSNVDIRGIETDGFGTAFARANGTLPAGVIIEGNWLHNMTSVVSNGPFTDQRLFGNRNVSGSVTS